MSIDDESSWCKRCGQRIPPGAESCGCGGRLRVARPMEQLVRVVVWSALVCAMLYVFVPMMPGYRGGPSRAASRGQGQATACKSNLKNIGTALELYSTDNSGRFPVRIGGLAPNYLKTIPTCPSTGLVTYVDGYASGSHPDAYTVCCSGFCHAAVNYTANYPQYTSTQGLLER